MKEYLSAFSFPSSESSMWLRRRESHIHHSAPGGGPCRPLGRPTLSAAAALPPFPLLATIGSARNAPAGEPLPAPRRRRRRPLGETSLTVPTCNILRVLAGTPSVPIVGRRIPSGSSTRVDDLPTGADMEETEDHR